MTKWDLFQVHKSGLTLKDQLLKFMTSTSKRKKYHIIISINTKKAFDKIQHRCMIKKEKVSVN